MAHDIKTMTDTTPAEHAAAEAGVVHSVDTWTISNLDDVSPVQIQLLSDTTVIWGPLILAAGKANHTVTFGAPIRTAEGEALNVQCITEGPGTAGARSSIAFHSGPAANSYYGKPL